jgi:hypothetical protein
LNIRCSNRWAKPVLPGLSFLDPTWYHTFTATMGALWSSLTIRVRPLSRTNLVKGMWISVSGAAPVAGTAIAAATRPNPRTAVRGVAGRLVILKTPG